MAREDAPRINMPETTPRPDGRALTGLAHQLRVQLVLAIARWPIWLTGSGKGRLVDANQARVEMAERLIEGLSAFDIVWAGDAPDEALDENRMPPWQRDDPPAR